MPSCSSSSNISSSLNAFTVVQGGSRLETQVRRVSGLTLGNVIRYDIFSNGYTASKANDAPNSEVFGVIESYDSSTDYFNVVIYGSINLPSTYLYSIDGSTGGSGGNDIYFLSGNTAGLLQNLAPTDLNYIIKPVYQAAPHGTNFTGVVMNYLGYRIGGDIESTLKDTELGNIQIIVGSDQFQNGYVDAKISHELPISDYAEFYERFDLMYGYVEKVTVSQAIGGGVIRGQQVYQNGVLIGTISMVGYFDKEIYIIKKPNASLISVNQNIVVRSGTNTIATFTPSTTEVYAVYSPTITLSNPLVIRANDGTLYDGVSQLVSVGIKVKPQGIKVSVPDNISVSSLTVDSIALGITWADLGTKIADFEARITALEA